MGFQTIKYIWNHPVSGRRKIASLFSFFKWQMSSRMFPGIKVIDWIEGTKLSVSRGETGVTGNLYCGLHEFEEMGFVLHVLRANDLFVDVGANAGTYTILASGVCGAQSIGFEPLPEAFSRYENNVQINNLENLVTLHNQGVADREGELRFSKDLDTENRVVLEENAQLNTEIVSVVSLDKVLDGTNPTVIKIDVEGYEKPVLLGALQCLKNVSLLGVIMETNSAGSEFGYTKEELHSIMNSYGFSPFFYHPFKRSFTAISSENESNLNCIFIRNMEEVKSGIASARRREVNGLMF